MASIKFATFNINNLFIRYKFGESYPGGPKAIGQLDPAKGFLPIYSSGSFEMFNDEERKMAVRALTDDGKSFPDIICLQEVESLIALRMFNELFMGNHYKNAMLVDSYDFRQIDVGILSNFPIQNIRSNVDIIDPAWQGQGASDYQEMHLFSRDCLEVELATSAHSSLTLFINHFKSKFAGIPPATVDKDQWLADKKADNDAKRLRQASGVLNIIQNRFPRADFNTKDFIVLGDFNEYPGAPSVASLWNNSGLEDVIARIANIEDRWTHYWAAKGRVSQLDHILVSPSIARNTKGVLPKIERRAIGYRGKSTKDDGGFLPKKVKLEPQVPIELDFQFERFSGISDKIYASDHCPVFFEIPV